VTDSGIDCLISTGLLGRAGNFDWPGLSFIRF